MRKVAFVVAFVVLSIVVIALAGQMMITPAEAKMALSPESTQIVAARAIRAQTGDNSVNTGVAETVIFGEISR